ncbi:MAG TPA: DUF2721 domain-containing protein [Thermoanaerobaculia bacterium]
MNGLFSASEVLGAMITPAVLISASGTLVLSTSNRLTRVVDRVRTLAEEAEEIHAEQGRDSGGAQARIQLISEQLPQLSARVLLLRSALTALYSAIGLLVATSIAVGVVAALRWSYGWIPIATGLAGGCALLYGSVLLVREARLAIGSTLQEMEYLRDVVARGSGNG